MCVVRCSLFVVRCVLSVGCLRFWLLIVDCCLLFVVSVFFCVVDWRLLCVGCCSLFDVLCVFGLFVVCGSLLVVCCLLFVVSCVLFVVKV